jgi:hypothetical protein
MIRLQSISMQNFRGVKEGKIDGFTDVNILVGRNNSGKTTVVEAITRVAVAGGLHLDLFGRTVDAVWLKARSATVEGGNRGGNIDPRLLWYRQDQSKDLRITGLLRDGMDAGNMDELVYNPKPHSHQTGMQKPPRTPKLDPQGKQQFCSAITVFRPADAYNAGIEQKFWSLLLSDRRDRILTQTLNEVFSLDAESFHPAFRGLKEVIIPELSRMLNRGIVSQVASIKGVAPIR